MSLDNKSLNFDPYPKRALQHIIDALLEQLERFVLFMWEDLELSTNV